VPRTFLNRAPNHWAKNAGSLPSDSPPAVELASGLHVWVQDGNTDFLRVNGIMPPTYAGEDLTFSMVWTVPAGVSGNLNCGGNFRRFIAGVNPLLPESAGFGPGLVAAPTPGRPALWTVTITNAATAPLFPGGLGGVQANEQFYVKLGRSGGTTLTGAMYILGLEGSF